MLYSNNSLFAPWTIVSAHKTIEYIVSNQPHVEVDLNSNSADTPVSIQQIVTTTVGSTYRILFSLHSLHLSDHCVLGESKTGYVTATGGSNQTFVSSDTTRQITYVFRAIDSQSAVEIGSTTYGTICGPIIFNINMTAF